MGMVVFMVLKYSFPTVKYFGLEFEERWYIRIPIGNIRIPIGNIRIPIGNIRIPI